jgi:hypothetical protein
MYYDECCDIHGGLVVDKPIWGTFINEDNGDSIRKYIRMAGGIPVRQDGRNFGYRDPYDDGYNPELVEWVTPITTYNRIKVVYATCLKSRLNSIDEDACMIIRIGKVGDRRIQQPRR